MKTITKKMLSVLMAVLVLLGGIGISLAIEPATADDIAYDSVYDYSTLTMNTCYDSSNLDATGAYVIGGTPLYMESSAGLNPGWGDLKDSDWGTVEQAYVIYNVAAGSKFEATVKIGSSQSRQNIENATGEPFEFVIEASANGTDGWQTVGTTAGNEGTIDSSNNAFTDIVLTCDVPDNCSFVKITFPQKGKIVYSWATSAGNDMARLSGVRFFKYVAPAPSYDSVYDYSTLTMNNCYDSSNLNATGAYAIGGTPLYMESSAGLNPGWGDLKDSDWGTVEQAYVIYNVAAGSSFEATVKIGSSQSRQNIENATGEPFEFVIEASANGTDGWQTIGTTAGNEGTIDSSNNAFTDIVLTCDVPDNCSFVKITFPQKGKIVYSWATSAGNDMARLSGVRFFKYVAPAPSFDSVYDYSNVPTSHSLGTSDLGAYAIGDTDLWRDSGVGINPGFGDLKNNAWGTVENAYVVYKVAAGTKFEATIKMANSENRQTYKSKTGDPFEFVIEASANGTDGWKTIGTTEGIDGTIDSSNGAYTDIVLTCDVPEDCTFVKITFPQQGGIDLGYTIAAGNDMGRLCGVKFFKYVAPPVAYDAIYDYSTLKKDTLYSMDNLADTGAYKFGGAAIYREGNAPGINPGWGELNKPWGEAEKAYIIYRVIAGTKFEATLKIAANTNEFRKKFTTVTGEPFEFVIEASANGADGWQTIATTENIDGTIDASNSAYTDIVLTCDVPADCAFVKITFPQQGIIDCGSWKPAGNDMARLCGVKFFKYVAPPATYDTTHDYSDTSVKTDAVNGSNIGSYGIYSYNNSVKAPALWINDDIGNAYRGGISPGYGNLGMPWGELEKNFVIYEVKPGTFFELTARMYDSSSRKNFANKTGEPFEFTIEASTNDMGGWRHKVDTSSASGVAAGPYYDYTVTYEVPADCSFVKVTFPQRGIIPGTSTRANDAARIMKVRLTAAKNFYTGTDTFINYKANGAVDFFYDNDAALLYLYKMNGTVIENFSNGAAYVAPSVSYLNSGTGIEKPYVIYAIEGGTKFVAGFNVNREAAAALGADFAMKLYESTNGANWTLVSTEVESVGDTDYHTFTAAANSKYVKIEYPHTDAVKGVDKVNEIYGLIAIGFNPLESAYDVANPYGNYTFKNVDKFYGDALSAHYSVENFGIYEDIGGVFAFDSGAMGKPYHYLSYGYSNLVNNTGSDYCGLAYSVKPGTAFQAVALTSRNNGDCQLVERATGKPFDIIVQVSSNGKTWTDYSPSRILTDKHLMGLSNLVASERYVTEVITIPVLPSDVKFVRLLYPHTASAKVMTGGVDWRAGNDFIGLTQVSFTKGDAVPPHLYEPDNSKYEDIYDFTESSQDFSALNPTGLGYDVNLGSLSPSWSYFSVTGKIIREKCAVTVSVKEGSAFFVDFGYRPDRFKLMEGEDYRVKLYFSSDCNNWTHVTDKYVKVAPGTGALTLVHRFEIDKLPAGVKYVKVEFPHDHDMRGDVTAAGKVHGLLGNDNCGLKKIFFTSADHHNYEHIIQHGYFFEEYEEFPEEIYEKNAKVLGLYDFTKNAFMIGNYTNSEANDGRITIKESYLFNKKEVDPIYVTYNVVPGTEFYIKVPVTDQNTQRLTVMPTARMKIYASETGKDGSWKEITNYFYTDNGFNTETSYYINNVGAKTNFIKVVFPNTGDLVAQGLSDATSGANFFVIKEVRATLVDYDPTWEETSDKIDFTKPNLNNKVDSGTTVVVNPFNWLFVIIPAAAVLLLGAAALVIILIIKKKKKTANQ